MCAKSSVHASFVDPPADPRGGNLNMPRALLPKGSPEWCFRTIGRLKWALGDIKVLQDEFDKVLIELEEARAWEFYPTPENHYKDLDDMIVHELGMTQAQARKSKAEQIIERAMDATPLLEHGGDKVKPDFEGVITPSNRGTGNADYLTARIARDAPEILEDMKAGKYKSVAAAAREAGIIQSVSVHLNVVNPAKAAAQIKRYYKGEQLAELIRLLQEDRQ